MEPNRSDFCSIGLVIELELFGEFDYQTQSNQSNSIDAISSILFGRKTKRIQCQLNYISERSPSSMYLKQFENKNISINPELTKLFIV